MKRVQGREADSGTATAGGAAAAGVAAELLSLLKSPSLYACALVLFLGIQANMFAQTYLRDCVASGHPLPALSDLLLDNLPYWDIDYLYDIFSLVSLLVFCVYVFHRKELARVPYYLLLCGIFMLTRGVFIVLTPLGNPPMFDGTEGPFSGFSKFEYGVYPSGHIGTSFMYFLLAADRRYQALLLLCVGVIVISLFLSRGHYSIDVLSGIFFAYAIRSFGEKYLLRLVVRTHGLPADLPPGGGEPHPG